ncbi:hypothetical protein LT679_06835 [Mucilaginibacter roseus]|uniref:Uncharacterized protein n=1 Tax=Mucilaginibacter roseus TaxID=1528868 RepID=A0ABS8TZL6_9SPHI|nr:hypothetical protein [Mucilaginibacter roseus]MCD8740314.1 hypothetical protein [Mucilaginibacter roseus]
MNKTFTLRNLPITIVLLLPTGTVFIPSIDKSAVVFVMLLIAVLIAISYGKLVKHIVCNWPIYNKSSKIVNVIVALYLLPMLLLMLFLPFAVVAIQC